MIRNALVVAFAACVAFAQDIPRVGVGPVQRELTLEQSIEMAMKNNLEVEIERRQIGISEQAVIASRGFYDPRFRWLPSLASNNQPTENALLGADAKLANRLFNQNFYFSQPLPFQGTKFDVSFENGRTSTNNPFASLNPFTRSSLVLSFTQPLLRGRETDQARTQIEVRQKNVDISKIDFELRAIDVVLRVQQAYWDLVAARQDVVVKSDSVDLAKDQLERGRRQIAAGVLAPVELAAAQAELDRRLDTLYQSVGVVTAVENTLKTLLAPDLQDPIWNDELIPVEQRTLNGPPEVFEIRAQVDEAVRNRPEVRSLSLRQEVNEVERKLNANQVKPELNLVASYTNAGLAGSLTPGGNPFSSSQAATLERLNQLSQIAGLPPLPPVSFASPPDQVLGGYGQVLSSLFGGTYQSAQVGLQFDWTFRNRTARANLTTNAIVDRQLKLRQAQTEQLIAAEVRNAYQAIQTARQRMQAAQSASTAAKEKLDSETRLFQTGESTNFLVLTRQNEYADSRRREVEATLGFNRAVAQLEKALGTSLQQHNIVLQ